MSDRILVAFLVVAAALVQSNSAAHAANSKPKLKICLNQGTGALIAKTKCSKSESILSLDALTSSVATVKGDTGPKGETGPAGPKGETGANGILGLGSNLPSGLTIFGYVEVDSHTQSIGADFRASGSLPAPAPFVLGDENVVVANNAFVATGCSGSTCLASSELPLSSVCTGSAEVPSAPSGVLCIYPSGRVNFTNIKGLSGTQFGFFVSGVAQASGDVFFRATWAYKVP